MSNPDLTTNYDGMPLIAIYATEILTEKRILDEDTAEMLEAAIDNDPRLQEMLDRWMDALATDTLDQQADYIVVDARIEWLARLDQQDPYALAVAAAVARWQAHCELAVQLAKTGD